MPTRMRHRKCSAVALALSLCTAAALAQAQQYAFDWNPRTGDAWVDTRLADINAYAQRYRDAFVDEMARYHGAPRALVTDLLTQRRWAPGDVYYACAIAQIIGRPCRHVVDQFSRDHGQGWGAVAQRVGIAPGSPQFDRLKRGFVSSYDRWARPIVLDDELRRAFPDRARDPARRPEGRTGKAPASEAVRGNGRQMKADGAGAKRSRRED